MLLLLLQNQIQKQTHKGLGVQIQNQTQYLIQNQAHAICSKDHEYIFEPKIPPGHMILFPSWIEHQVRPGNEGHTIAGNIELKE